MQLFLVLLLTSSTSGLEFLFGDAKLEGQSWLAGTLKTVKSWMNGGEGKKEETAWMCGSKRLRLSEEVAQFFTRAVCPSLYATVNQACIHHDLCYDSGTSSRAHCDQIFCATLRDMDLDKAKNCWIQETFCFMVKNFGQLVFKKPAKLKEAEAEEDVDQLPL